MLGDALRRLVRTVPVALSRLDAVDRDRAIEATDLAAPVMVTGGLRILLRLADFLMVGLALGDAALAGLELGFQYYFVGFGLALAVSSGTISVVSRLQGSGEPERANLAVKQSLWLAIVLSLPLTAIAWVYPTALLDSLSNDPAAIQYGATYLAIVMLSMVPRFWSMVAARALAGSADTRTPMYVRLLTVPTNVGLNGVLIFGLGPVAPMGIAGAAWGTVAANTLAAVIFFVLLASGRYATALPLGGKQFDLGLLAELVRVALPLSGMRLLQTFGRFPFLFILGVLGTPTLAAYAIGRRVMLLALMPAWGYATAASTLVGQSLGADDPKEATAYGWQSLGVALAVQLTVALLLVVFARPIVALFGTAYPDLAATFVRVFGLLVAGFSVSRTMRGSLRGAGDTRWPLYGTVLGSYCYRLPVAALALPTAFVIPIPVTGVSFSPGLGLGLPAIFAALIGDFYLKAAVNVGRFRSGKWRAVAHRAGVGRTDK
ncbi:MATE family efflux transporter [Haloarcula marismortui]|uniref:MATE family efflux transporter n=1 Tax=Haloarcula marismortui TaxID=2238 RepID=UPI003C796825